MTLTKPLDNLNTGGMNKTPMAHKKTAERNWLLIDASGYNLGRLSTRVASLLRGKHKPTFTPHADTGDFVVVINSDKVQLSGNKMEQKEYFRHTGWFGGIKSIKAKQLKKTKSDQWVRSAIQGMLPKNKLSNKIIKKLFVYKNSEHQHQAQKPTLFTLDGVNNNGK